MDFTCRGHDILITPHKRNEVERSVGDADAAQRWRVENTLLLAIRIVRAYSTQTFAAHHHPTLRNYIV